MAYVSLNYPHPVPNRQSQITHCFTQCGIILTIGAPSAIKSVALLGGGPEGDQMMRKKRTATIMAGVATMMMVATPAMAGSSGGSINCDYTGDGGAYVRVTGWYTVSAYVGMSGIDYASGTPSIPATASASNPAQGTMSWQQTWSNSYTSKDLYCYW